jgi:hypothetical protein
MAMMAVTARAFWMRIWHLPSEFFVGHMVAETAGIRNPTSGLPVIASEATCPP